MFLDNKDNNNSDNDNSNDIDFDTVIITSIKRYHNELYAQHPASDQLATPEVMTY